MLHRMKSKLYIGTGGNKVENNVHKNRQIQFCGRLTVGDVGHPKQYYTLKREQVVP